MKLVHYYRLTILKTNNSYILLILACIATLLFSACEPETTCHQELGAAVQITLDATYINAESKETHTSQWDSVAVVGVDNSVGMIGNNIASMGSELRPDTTITKYLFLYHEQIDTLYIQHTPRQHFISLACGCDVYHTIIAAWSSDSRIDSVAIINASVENVSQENLRIYLHE
jgi:hypothetical protein